MQIVYSNAAEAGAHAIENWQALDSTKFSPDKQGMDLLRGSLGHPLNFAQPSVRCVVSGVHGLDGDSCTERFVVASRLWAEGMYVYGCPEVFVGRRQNLTWILLAVLVAERRNTWPRVASWPAF